MNLYIRVGSITNAQRGRRILKIEGYSAFIKKQKIRLIQKAAVMHW